MADGAQYDVGVRLKGDGSGLVGETKAGIDAMRQLEDQARRTGRAIGEQTEAQRNARFENSLVKKILDEQNGAQAGVTRAVDDYSRAVRGSTTETLAATAAKAGLLTVLRGALGIFGGPAGIIALLSTAALGWTSFGASATDAAKEVEEAAQKSARAIAQMSAVERMQAQSAALYEESRQTRERMNSREMAARATRAAGIVVPVDRANEVDAARLAEIGQQLAALEETLGKWLTNPDAFGAAGTPGAGREELARQARELERLRALGVKSEEEYLRAQQAIIEANDTITRQEALRAQRERQRLEALGQESELQAAIAEHRKREESDELLKDRRLREQRERLRADAKDRAEADRQAAEQARRAQEAWERTADNIERSLTDAIIRGGKSGLEYLQAAMRAAILTPIIQPMVRPIAQAAASVSQGIFGNGVGAPGIAGGVFGGGGGGVGGMGAAFGGSQLFADFGNYFGNIGSVTEAGATYGFTDALGGFVGANPWVPYIGAGMQLLQGNVAGAGLSAGLTYAGGAMFGPLGAVGGAVAGQLLGGMLGGDGDAQRTGDFVGGFGERAFSRNNQWFSGAEMGGALEAFSAQLAAREQNLIRNLGLNGSQIGAVNAALAGANSQRYGFGMEHTPVEQSGAFEQIQAARLQAISSALGRSIQELTQVMSMSAEQWQAAIEQMEQAVKQGEQALAQAVRALPQQLGITGLEAFQRSLAVSEVNAPLDRVAAARTQYEETLALAQGGDLDAVRAFPQMAQQLLGIGRDTFASGSGFQDLFREVNRELAGVLARQQELQLDILRDVPDAVMEASQDQVTALRLGFRQMVEKLDTLQRVLERTLAR